MKSWEFAFEQLKNKDEPGRKGKASSRRVLSGGCVLLTLPAKAFRATGGR